MLKDIKIWLVHKNLAKPFFFAYLSVTFVIMLMPTNNLIIEEDWMDVLKIDKLVHFCIFSILTLLLYFYRKQKTILLFALFVFAISFLIEILQYILPTNRGFDLFDLVANLVGISFGSYLIYKFG